MLKPITIQTSLFFRKVLAPDDNVMLNFFRVILARHDQCLIFKYYFTENLW